jgi:hypothetical protein
MSTDFRALCAELANDLEEWVDGYLISDPADEHTAASFGRINRARAALAAESVAPTDQEIEEWADAAAEMPLEELDPEVRGWRRCFTKEEFGASIRAALARWGTPANNTGGTH